MCEIKVLDCTLREGGYVNNWQFGHENISEIMINLTKAKIDFIECGYLKPVNFNKNKSIFSTVSDIETSFKNKNLALMINFGEYTDIPQGTNIFLRIAFKKHEYKSALDYCKKLKDNGNKIFINPMHTNTYSDDEFTDMINIVNKIQPYAFTVTDSTGSMKKDDLQMIMTKINDNLNEDINLCFHSHNNLQLSFPNSEYLIKNCKKRDLILDSTLSGIGRGAGNLCTEVITRYLNDYYGKNYDTNIILELIEKYIDLIYKKTPWGYSVPYYLSGVYGCHPYYAGYLIDRALSYEEMDKILQKIPQDKKTTYNEELIKNLLKMLNFLNYEV